MRRLGKAAIIRWRSLAGFGEQQSRVTARFSKRDWVVANTFPFVAVSLTRNQSTIDLYDFARERVEFGFTREF